MKKGEQGNPRVRASIYAMAALYLAYLYYQTAAPFLKGAEDRPTAFQFGLGTVILGGGAVLLGVLAWKMYRKYQNAPPELPEEEAEEENEDLS